jgi:hypothetical protein
MEAEEIEALLALDVPAHLATKDDQGLPMVIPIWFLWTGQEFVMTSVAHRPHVRRLQASPVASICVDVEDPERADGQRPNRQVRASGTVALRRDPGLVSPTVCGNDAPADAWFLPSVAFTRPRARSASITYR